MMTQFNRVFSLLSISLTIVNIVNAGISPAACEIDRSTASYGATVRFYEYPAGDDVTYKDNDFLSGGYLANKYVGSVTGVGPTQEMRWASGLNLEEPPFGFTGVAVDHFLMEITGFYFATQTGVHNIDLHLDGSAALFMGSGLAFDCCGQQDDFTSNTAIFTSALDQSNVPKQLYLEAGSFYPFKMVYVNNEGPGEFELEIIRPDGSVDLTVGNNIYTIGKAETSNCNPVSYTHIFTTQYKTVATTTVTYTTSAVTVLTTVSSGTTSWINDDNGEVTVIIVVEVPEPIARTSYTTGPVTEATAITTITTFTIGTDGSTTPDTIIVIETPPFPTAATSSRTESVTETTTAVGTVGTDSSTVTVTTSSVSTTDPGTHSVIITSLTEGITSIVSSSTSRSSGMFYGNSTSPTTSTRQISSEVTSQSTPATRGPATPIPTPTSSPDNPPATSAASHTTPAATTTSSPVSSTNAPASSTDSPASSTNSPASPDTTKTVPSSKPTVPAGDEGSSDNNSGGISASGNEGSSSNGGNGNASAPGGEDSANNGSYNPSTPDNVGSSNNEGSSDNGNTGQNGNDDDNKNGEAGTVIIEKPYPSATVPITNSVSAYEGVGAVTKKWSLPSLMGILILAIV